MLNSLLSKNNTVLRKDAGFSQNLKSGKLNQQEWTILLRKGNIVNQHAYYSGITYMTKHFLVILTADRLILAIKIFLGLQCRSSLSFIFLLFIYFFFFCFFVFCFFFLRGRGGILTIPNILPCSIYTAVLYVSPYP